MNCKAKTAAILVAALLCLIASPAAHAARATNTMNVKLQVINGCALNVANMDFGIITQVTGTETAKSYVTVVCNRFAGVNLSFAPTYSVANTSRNSFLTSPAGGKINFSMVLEGSSGNLFSGQTGYTYIDGQLSATPGAAPGVYQSTETLYVLY
ncbi:MAG: spore coat protein U domain-containing protein [Aestuariivirga sp.]